MKLSTKQIADMLCVSTRSLMTIKSNGELHKRLESIGYKVVKEYKEGRSVYYLVELTKNKDKSAVIQLFNKRVFGVANDKFKDYYVKRTAASKGKDTEAYELMTKQNIAEELGVTRQTVGTWDAKLVELGVLDEDDRIYLYVQSVPEQKIFKTSIDDYKHYHKTLINAKKAYAALKAAHNNGLIDDFTLEFAYKEYKSKLEEMSANHVVRIKAYKLNEENPTHKEAIRLYTE